LVRRVPWALGAFKGCAAIPARRGRLARKDFADLMVRRGLLARKALWDSEDTLARKAPRARFPKARSWHFQSP
jgi:hypothetical protein